jgi:hypothetical protein
MALRRAVPKIPTKSSVPPRLPLHKSRSVKTPSESTLPQLLIPLHFNSFRSNTYKKPRGRAPSPAPTFCNSSLPPRRPCVHAGIRAIPFRSYVYFITSAPPRVGGRGTGLLCATSAPCASLRYPFPGFPFPQLCHPERSEDLCASERVPRGESAFFSTCLLSSPLYPYLLFRTFTGHGSQPTGHFSRVTGHGSRPICTAAGIQLK